MCANWLCASRIGLGWAHDAFYIVCHMFMHFPCIRTLFLIYFDIFELLGTFLIVSLCLLLFLFTLVMFMAPKRKSTPSQNPLRSATSTSSDPTPSHIRFCDEGLLGELFSTRHSFWTSSHSGGLRRHWPTRCHSQSWLGVTVWRPGHISISADPGVLLQHAWIWFFNTSLSYSHSRYTHCYHTATCCGCASCP